MAQNTGTLLGAPIRPADSLDQFPAFHANEGKGGFFSVPDIATRNAIPSARREIGMRVKVVSEDKDYELVGGITNADWSEKIYGSGNGVTDLSNTPSPTGITLGSSTGAGTTLPLANETNAGLFAPAEKSKLSSITEIFTTALKVNYDNAVNWINTNGTNLVNHLSSTANAHAISAITGLLDALNAKLDKEDLPVTPVAGVINSTLEMTDRVLILNVGSTATTFNINHALRNVGLKKKGSGVVTFVSGAGRTLNTLTSTDKLTADGAVGTLDADGTVDNLYTNDGTEEALLKSGYKNGALIATDFTGSPRKATVGFVTEYPDANYRIWINFVRVSGSLYSFPYVIPQSSITNAGFEIELDTASEPTGLIVEWQTFRNE